MEKVKEKQFFCKNHKQMAFELFIKPDQTEFICFKCKQNFKKYPQQFIVNLNEVLEYDSSQNIINNFPPMMEEDFYLKYNIDESSEQNLNQYSIKLFQIMDDINKYFSELKNETLKQIDRANNIAQEKLKNILREYDKIFQVYDEISRKEKLKNIIENHNDKTNAHLQSFINEQFINREVNQAALLEKIQKFQQHFQEINFSQPQDIKNLLISSIESINFFNNLNQNNSLMQNAQIINQHEQDIFNLISNQTNFCMSSFLDQFQVFCQKYRYLFQSFPFDQIKQDEVKTNRFMKSLGNLSEDKFLRINAFSEVIDEVDQQVKSFLEMQFSNHLNQRCFSDQIISQLNLKNAYFEQMQQKSIFNKIYLNQINILPYLDFLNGVVAGKICNLQIENKRDCIKISKLNIFDWEFASLNLNNSFQYQFKIRIYSQNINMNFKNSIQLAHMVHFNLIPLHIFYISHRNLESNTQTIDGKTFFILDLNVEIHLQKCIYSILDISNGEYKLLNTSQILLNTQYLFLIHLHTKDDFIEIKEAIIKI